MGNLDMHRVQQLARLPTTKRKKKSWTGGCLCGPYLNAGSLEEFWEFSTLCTARQLRSK
jgi:hypothetical protein